MIYGDIITGTYGPGSEVAAWDASGVLRFRTDILTDAFGPYFEMSQFYGPPTGSDDPDDFIWQIYDGSTLWSATIDSTNWPAWEGNRDPFWLNLDRDQPLHVAPEPATLVIFALLSGSGVLAGLKKRGKWKR